jgi:hypothetical protein
MSTLSASPVVAAAGGLMWTQLAILRRLARFTPGAMRWG